MSTSGEKRAWQHVTFTIGWAEFDNDDLADDDGSAIPPDKGWYVTVETPDKHSHDIVEQAIRGKDTVDG